MRAAACLCALLIAIVLLSCVDGRKTFSTRRKSGNSRRGGSTTFKQKQPPPPVTQQKVDSFLAAERAGSSHGSSGTPAITNTHYRGSPFDSKSQPPKQTVPQTNGPIGFDKVNQGNQKPLGFDRVNSEVQQKSPSSNVPSAPAYPGKAPPAASAPNGPPPAYPGYGSNTGSHGGYEAPPAYPGRPVNAPPVYSANNPSYGQKPAYGGYPAQQNYPGQQSYPGQQNYPGYPNSGSSFGGYPNQGFGQGGMGYPSGGYNNWHSGGSSYPGGFGGNPYGGSPFGQSNPYGGSPFGGHSQYGGYSGFGGNPHYSPNNFGFSNNPGFFGSSPGYSKYGNFMGQHKKSRWGGLPIPIPIPIPIPLGMFGGFGGGRSYNHRVLDTFVKNQTIDPSNNETTNVYILNNSTVTPCTTDQFIYDSLNVTVLSCTAGNCTAIKVFTTTNVSGAISTHSAGITMCHEDNNTTYSSFADNVNPTVSDLHKYWMRVCKEGVITSTNKVENITEQAAANITVKIEELHINETMKGDTNATTQWDIPSSNTNTSLPSVETTTTADSSATSLPANSTVFSSTTVTNHSSCEIFNCSWIEMCLPSIELVDKCSTPDCPFTRTGYRPCVRVKMCKSPSTPLSTFATLNNTVSRIDQSNNITSVSDVANLTLISYVPPTFPVNCSQDTSNPACLPPVNVPQLPCSSANTTAANGTDCVPVDSVSVPTALNTTEGETLSTESTTVFPELKSTVLDMEILEELKRNLTLAYNQMEEMRRKLESDKQAQSS